MYRLAHFQFPDGLDSSSKRVIQVSEEENAWIVKIKFSLAPNTISEIVGLWFHYFCQIGVIDWVSVGLYLNIKALFVIKCVPTAYAAVPAEFISKDLLLASS